MTSSFQCPRCGVSITYSENAVPAHCPTCHSQLEAAHKTRRLEMDVEYNLVAPPLGTQAEVLEATNDRLMLSIPGGRKGGNSLGCFGVLWLLITAAVSAAFLYGLISEQQGEKPPPFVFAILGLFWVIGLGFLYFAVKLNYTRGYLFVTQDRAVHQSIFMGRKKNTEITLNANSHAMLVESYRENDSPVYRIKIDTDGRDIHFGTGLPHELKEWFVETVNTFLVWVYGQGVDKPARERDLFGNVDRGQMCPMCGTVSEDDESDQCLSCGARWERSGGVIDSARIPEEIAPEELSPASYCSVSRTRSGDWVLTYAIRNLADNSRGSVGLLFFGLIWEGFISFFSFMVVSKGGGFGIFALLFTVPFHLVGILLLFLSVFAMFGKFRLNLASERSSAKWGIGSLGYTMRFATSSITDVYVKHGGALSSFKNKTNNPSRTSTSEGVSCILLAAGKRIPVTSDASYTESREIAGVIRYCLHELGHRLQDE